MERVTGWLDLVDDNTSFAKILCDNYEALVDEKRKRIGEEEHNKASQQEERRERRATPTYATERGLRNKHEPRWVEPTCLDGS